MMLKLYLIGLLVFTSALAWGAEVAQEDNHGPVFRKGPRPSIARRSAPVALAIPPVITTDMTEEVTRQLQNSLSSHLKSQEQFRVVDQAIIQDVWGQLKNDDQPECKDYACALEIGKWAEAQRVLMAKAWLDNTSWTLELRLVDAISGAVMKRVTDNFTGDTQGFLGKLVPDLVARVSVPLKTQARSTQKAVVKVVYKDKDGNPLESAPEPQVVAQKKGGTFWWWMSGGSALAVAGAAATYLALNPITQEKTTRVEMSRVVNIE